MNEIVDLCRSDDEAPLKMKGCAISLNTTKRRRIEKTTTIGQIPLFSTRDSPEDVQERYAFL